MGFLKKLKFAWKNASTAEKIGFVIDIISGVGCAAGGLALGNKLSEGKNKVEKICIKTACAGLSLAAENVSSKALRENYGDPIAALIDRAKASKSKKEEKEDDDE